ncbi:MAG: hypothetical protein ABWZ80_07095 [Beijerinckiaceae bacterium]
MGGCGYWASFLDAYRSSPDAIKALWALTPPALILGVAALLLRGRFSDRSPGELVCSIRRDADGALTFYRHRA